MNTKYSPTEAMQTNQKRGKALRGKKKTTRSYSNAYEVTSKSFCQDLELDDVKVLYKSLQALEKKLTKYNLDSDKEATHEYLDFLENGGSAGLAWCRKHLKDEGILQSFQKEIEEEELNTPESDRWDDIKIAKSVDQDLMQATFLVLQPEVADAHGDIYSEEEIRKGCHNFNQYCNVANLMHLVETTTFDIVESYICPVDMILNDQIVKAGSWLTVLQFFDEEVWEEVKKGNFNGVSISCKASVEKLEEEDDE